MQQLIYVKINRLTQTVQNRNELFLIILKRRNSAKKRALSPFPADAIFINIKHGIAEENEKHKRLSMHLKLALKVK